MLEGTQHLETVTEGSALVKIHLRKSDYDMWTFVSISGLACIFGGLGSPNLMYSFIQRLGVVTLNLATFTFDLRSVQTIY